MNLLQTFRVALRALMRNKARSFLTTLGIIIGVGAVIAMVAIGEGAKARVEESFASLGSNILIILPGTTTRGGAMGGFGSMPTLTWDDLKAIQSEAPAVRIAAPVLQTLGADHERGSELDHLCDRHHTGIFRRPQLECCKRLDVRSIRCRHRQQSGPAWSDGGGKAFRVRRGPGGTDGSNQEYPFPGGRRHGEEGPIADRSGLRRCGFYAPEYVSSENSGRASEVHFRGGFR